jgi:succinate dehydrogenase / fumarate reductase flavoprotein subunit
LADFFELAELMCIDAIERSESCGGHFRLEHQTEEGEAKRDDECYTHVSAWEYTGVLSEPRLHIEPLEFEEVRLTQRSYK